MLKSPMRIRYLALTLTLAIVASVAPASVAGAAEEPPEKQYLFTMEAARGVSVKGQKLNSGQLFTLVFAGLGPVTMFSDRPFREAGLISPKALVANWDTWFASSPPNAVLTWSRGTEKPPASIVVALGSPIIKDGVLAFRAARLSRVHEPVRHGRNWKPVPIPAVMQGVSLFIDSVSMDDSDEIDPEDEAIIEEDFNEDFFDDYGGISDGQDEALRP